MKDRIRRIASLKTELISKSREAALNAIRTYNDPQVTFKTESFIVLMVIAWTYLLHAYYRSKGIEYRYFKQHGKRRVFDKTKNNSYKYWELERCIFTEENPIDKNSANNLLFLIRLRHEIEHQMTLRLDTYLSGRFQACAINYNEYLKLFFGEEFGIDSQVAYSIQFIQLSDEQFSASNLDYIIPDRLKSFITEFDQKLSNEEFNSPRFSYRLLFTKKLVNRPGQADRVVEFIDPKSDLAKSIDKEYWVKKEVERPKFRATDAVNEVRKVGFSRFRVQPEHCRMWKVDDAKNPAKGFGIEIQGTWYWYQAWIDRCIELCKEAGDQYK